jgi:hypothetical protein
VVTAADRLHCWRVAQGWTRHVSLVGAAALRVADRGWQGRPPPAAPTSKPRLAIALVGEPWRGLDQGHPPV